MIKNPVLYDKEMSRKGVFAPADISVTQNVRPLSVGTIVYDREICPVNGLDFVQVFFPDDSFEFYRVKTVADEVGNLSTAAIEHSIVWLEDFICTEKVSFKGTATELLTKLLSYATDTRWRLGAVEHNEQIECEINFTNVMQGVMDALDLCEGYGYVFDQTGEEWIISLVKMEDDAGCEGRLSRNIIDAVVNVDYRDFATRLYVQGKDWHVDSDTINVWGVRENVLNTDTKGADDEELREQCRKYFREHSNPAISVQVEAHELGEITGQPFDYFEPGKMCRLCLMDYNGAVVMERITSRSYPNLMTSPEFVVLTMANKIPDTSSALNGLAVTTKTLATKVETELEDQWQGIEDIEGILTSEINAVSIRLDAESARIDLKAEQVQVNNLYTRVNDAFVEIDAANAEIALKAAQDEVDNLTNEVDNVRSELVVNIDGIRGQIQQGDQIMAELALTIEGLDNWVTDADGNVSELTNEVRGLQSTVTTVDGKIVTLSNTADGLRSTIMEQGVTLADLKTTSDEISATMKDVEGGIGSLVVTSDSVTAKVQTADNRVAALALTADGLTNTIAVQGVELASLKTRVDEISASVTDGNNTAASLVIQANRIAQKVTDVQNETSASFEVLSDRITSEVEDLRNDTNASFSVMSDNISSKVSKGSVISEINQSPEIIKINAPRINLEGYVTASQLSSVEASVSNLTSGLTTAMAIKALSINGNTVVANESIRTPSMQFNGNLVSQRAVTMGNIGTVGKALSTGGVLDLSHSHAVTVNDDGTVTLGGVSASGGNFKIADTKVYKDGVSAAYKEGWAAAVAMCAVELTGTYKNVITVKMPSSTVDEAADDDVFTVSSGGDLNAVVNRAPNVFHASGSAYAYIKRNDEERWNASTTSLSRATTINVGQ